MSIPKHTYKRWVCLLFKWKALHTQGRGVILSHSSFIYIDFKHTHTYIVELQPSFQNIESKGFFKGLFPSDFLATGDWHRAECKWMQSYKNAECSWNEMTMNQDKTKLSLYIYCDRSFSSGNSWVRESSFCFLCCTRIKDGDGLVWMFSKGRKWSLIFFQQE